MSDGGAAPLNELTARQALAALSKGKATPGELAASCRARIEAREPAIGAWQALDWDFVARQLAALPARGGKDAPLWGLPVGVKDLFDTVDLPTGYGSAIYDGHRPAADAAAVARLRACGAIVLGKTVTTEFAFWKQGKTRNPRNPAHSPGGSSSGSAAAVADFMAPLALGTQTAASTIRPAAYCGVVGFKPSAGLISLAGVKALANSLDTAGAFGRSVADCGLLAGALSDRPALIDPPAVARPPVLGLLRWPEWQHATPACLAAVEAATERLAEAGAVLRTGSAPAGFEGLAAAQTTIMAYEAARELAHERRAHIDMLSEPLRILLSQGEAVTAEHYDAARALGVECRAANKDLFAGAGVLIAPAAPSTAPHFEEGTGDPVMSRAWHLLGLPALSVPCGTDSAGLPFGLQIAGWPGGDAALLAIGNWIESCLAPPTRP